MEIHGNIQKILEHNGPVLVAKIGGTSQWLPQFVVIKKVSARGKDSVRLAVAE